MNLKIDDLEISGKGFSIEGEWLFDNIKIQCDGTEFHEVVVLDDDFPERVGWIVPTSFTLVADFTAHSDNGMRGKSTIDSCKAAFLLDLENYLGELVPETLTDVNTEKSQKILQRVLDKQSLGKGTLSADDEKALVIISTVSHLIFVQSEDTTVRIQTKDGIYVLQRRDEKDKLTMINNKDGVLHIGDDKNVAIGPDGIYINNKLLDIDQMVSNITKNVTQSVASALSGMKFDFDFDF